MDCRLPPWGEWQRERARLRGAAAAFEFFHDGAYSV
jgi:hypothetical protein